MSFNTKFNRRSFLMTGAALAGGLALAPRSVLAAQYRIDLSVNAGSSELAFAELFDTLGIAQKWDVELNTTPIADGSRIIASLISGTAAMCPGSGFSNVLVAIEKGADLKLVCGNSDKIAQAVFTKRDDIQSISDLAGKTIAVGAPGALLHQYMIAILRKHGGEFRQCGFKYKHISRGSGWHSRCRSRTVERLAVGRRTRAPRYC